MNINSNASNSNSPYPPQSYGGGGINPALLAGFPNQSQNPNRSKYGAGGGVNPAQLMNGMGMSLQQQQQQQQQQQHAQGGLMAMNPAQLLQQPQMLNGMGMGTGMGSGMATNMGLGGINMGINNAAGTGTMMGINPAALSSNSNASSSPSNPSSNPNLPSNSNIADFLGISPAQFSSLSTQERERVAQTMQQRHQANIRQKQAAMMAMSGGMPQGITAQQQLQQGMANPQFREQAQLHFREQQLQQQQQQQQAMGMSMGMGGQNQVQQNQFRDGMGPMGAMAGMQNMNAMNQFRDQSMMGMGGGMQLSPQQQQHQMMTMGMGMPPYGAGGQNPNQNQSQNQAVNNAQQQQDLMQGMMRSMSGNAGSAGPVSAGGAIGSGFYDRPLSSASGSSHVSQNQAQNPNQQQQPQQSGMMPPPSGLPRPTGGNMNPMNAMGMNMRAGGGMGGPGGGGGVMRPPSRAMSSTPMSMDMGGMNGYGGNKPNQGMSPQQQQNQQLQAQQANPYPQHGQGGGMGQYLSQQQQQPPQQSHQQQYPHQQQSSQSQQPGTPGGGGTSSSPYPPSSGSPPIPGSPHRGSKRKVGSVGVESPRIGMSGGMSLSGGLPMNTGGGMGAGTMGPPSMPQGLSASGDVNGYPAAQPQSHQHQQQGQHGQTPRPPSSMGLGLGVMNGVGGGGMGGMGNMNMNMLGMSGLTAELPSRPVHPSQGPPPQQQQHQRQASLPRQGSVPLGMGPKAGSVPPLDLSGGMNMSVAPAGIGPMGTQAPTVSAAASVPTPTSITAPAVSSAPPSATPSTSATPAAPATAPAPQVIPHLPPLPANVSMNPNVTRVSVVPLIDSLKHIPALSGAEIEDVKGWMARDREYEALARRTSERMVEEVREGMYGWGKGGWWEKGGGSVEGGRWRARRGREGEREGFDVRYPRTRRDRDARGRRPKREGLKLPRKLHPADVNRPEQLVPIRLEFDVDHHKMRDTFVWNLNDPIVTPEIFAQTVVEDYNLPLNYHNVITKSIQDQLSDFKAHSGLYDGDSADGASPVMLTFGLDNGEDTVQKGCLEGEDEKWWSEWRKRLRVIEKGPRKKTPRARKRIKLVNGENEGAEGDVEDAGEDDDVSMIWEKSVGPEEISINEQLTHEEMRILIKLDIIIGSMKLDDQLEWDLDNEYASPEDFADVYTQELGLNGEFRTAIAHSIREQIQTYQKSLFLVGHPSDGSAVQDEDLRLSFLPSLASATRPVDQVLSFTPLLNYLSDGEIEKNEKDREKDMNRRRKRNTRGRRGIALPDREPIRTYRTPAIGFPELDPATLALSVAANAPVSRRAAAAAASVTIANMVASENGTTYMPQMAQPSAPPPPTLKDKKTAKGHFKAPSYPQSILRPRAHVTAPTPSTAADVSKLPAPLENDPPPPVVTIQNNVGGPPPDSKIAKVISAKRAKELEREAKEKEFADGQHPNMINGVWHCSNCGCPESIAIGRRKGPLGDKSQCGTCGKYWHRHRRPRPIEYNSDPDFHSGVKRETDLAKTTTTNKKKGSAAALRAQTATLPPTPAETSEPQSPSRSNGDVDMSSRLSPAPAVAPSEEDKVMSPVSTASSASEPPLAQRVKLNGMNSHTRAASPTTPVPAPAPAPTTPAPVSAAVKQEASPNKYPHGSPPNSEKTKPADSAAAPPTSPVTRPWPPQWLSQAKEAMKSKYPNDKFDIILRKVNANSPPEWRIKCLDCPGKLYTPGPGETLSNYEVHLKNRLHRQRVNDRVNGTDS